METKLLDVRQPESPQAQAAIDEAARILRAGGLVAFPTETVYGLGGDALNPGAAQAIYQAKGRPSDNPLIVHIADEEQLTLLTGRVPLEARKLMRAFWPGPLTMIFEKTPQVPRGTTGGLDTVAVRMPDDPVTLALIRRCGCCLAGPSANLSGGPSPTSWEHVFRDLNGRIDGILQSGDCRVGIESTVLDMTGDCPTVLRPGWITPEQISQVTGGPVEMDPALFVNRPRDVSTDKTSHVPADDASHVPADKTSHVPSDDAGRMLEEQLSGPPPKAPGMKYKHYAPKAQMVILQGECQAVHRAAQELVREKEAEGCKVAALLFSDDDLAQAAHRLFSELRRCDEEGVDFIVASAVESSDSVGFAIMNRMLKSAGYHVIQVE